MESTEELKERYIKERLETHSRDIESLNKHVSEHYASLHDLKVETKLINQHLTTQDQKLDSHEHKLDEINKGVNNHLTDTARDIGALKTNSEWYKWIGITIGTAIIGAFVKLLFFS